MRVVTEAVFVIALAAICRQFFSFANYKNLPKCWSNLRQKKEKKIYCIVQRLFLMSWLRIKKATSTGRHLFRKAMFEKNQRVSTQNFFKKDELYSFFEADRSLLKLAKNPSFRKKTWKGKTHQERKIFWKKQDFPRVSKRTFTSLITEIYQKESRSTFCGFSQEVRNSFLQKLRRRSEKFKNATFKNDIFGWSPKTISHIWAVRKFCSQRRFVKKNETGRILLEHHHVCLHLTWYVCRKNIDFESRRGKILN